MYQLNRRWRFLGELTSASQTLPGFDDSAFPEIRLPHSVVPGLGWKGWQGDTWSKKWVYRRTVERPADTSGMRVFLDFQGAQASATVTVDGTPLPEHLGGYLPFSHEVTELLEPGKKSLVAVTLDGPMKRADGTWPAVPPDGAQAGPAAIDWLAPSGIHRQVSLRAVPQMFISDVWASPADVLDAGRRRVDVACEIDAAVTPSQPVRLVARLWDGNTKIAEDSASVAAGTTNVDLSLTGLSGTRLWSVDNPKLYDLYVLLYVGDTAVHRFRRRVGLREARFETDGFYLNGEKQRIFGLNRHEIYPYTGLAMPPRVQRRDAEMLRRDLNCTMVRCSHYPQSEAFLDACDELGLLVWQELPGWQYLGGTVWQDRAVGMVKDMIRRDRSRPSVVLWGVRINESVNSPLHLRCENAAKELDPTRQTTGAMNLDSAAEVSGFAHDVFSYNDYQDVGGEVKLKEPSRLAYPSARKPYLISESVGQFPKYTNPVMRTHTMAVQHKQAWHHAQAHDQAIGKQSCCGMIAWAAFDYPSGRPNAVDKMKWPGIADVFRVPKPGASIYEAQISPEKRPVIAPAFYWPFLPPPPVNGVPQPDPRTDAMICSNCDTLEIYLDGELKGTVTPDSTRFPNLPFPPSFADLTFPAGTAPELRIDGFVGGTKVVSRTFSGDKTGDRLEVSLDDTTLSGNGFDATRAVFRVVDEHGNFRAYTAGDVTLELSGPGVLIGQTPFALDANGGVGAVWIRTMPASSGTIRLTAKLAGYPDASATITVAYAAPEVA
ncbi:glycoside hydrolase family 2 TIM barrel-domain containing protein [Streptomyces sp. NPDC001046]|uniref:glycoside hydrolase family 2 protein n=1 Tax=Streptomyces sp. NPDC001046 TaxID=3364543 RepID=UPI00367FFA16